MIRRYHAPMFEGRDIACTLTPLEALARWPEDRPVVMLHSGRPHARWSRWTMLAQPRDMLRFDETALGQGVSQWIADAPPPVALAHRPLTDLRAATAARPGLWIGYLSYDVRLWTEPILRRTASAPSDRRWPIVEFAHCPGYLVHDTLTGRWRACGSWRDDASVCPLRDTAATRLLSSGVTPTPAWPRHKYESAVARIREYIAAGDVFQVNLAQQFTATIDGPHPLVSRGLFARLATASPAWYGAYLESTRGDRVLMSTSPELFLEVDAGGQVVTRPIKGTRPAAADPAELRHSVKDQAELAMIVDLLRNDLGRVCAYGSVRVAEPRVIETHPTIHHGVATITGQLHHSRDLFDLLRAAMPGGSITGAPKVRAMQIIDELEGVRRGPYCGAIGWIRGNTCGLNVAIRTMLHDVAADRVDLWAGGGIVADSDPAAEYDETLTKTAAMLAALTGP